MAASSQDDAQEALTNASASGADCYELDGGEQLMELSSSGSKQHLPKARKPYTISKQREKWTEEEHQKFLEALKLYGRGWRKIQEHVGTKTAVQIRSHAQKFFSKVVRETTVGAEASIKSIEIPPPRPKRKPLHPYPRKCVDVCSDQFERSQSPSSLGVERESQSPTSVLAPVCSDTFGSPQSEQQNGCSSLTSCDSQQSLDVLPNEKDSEPIMSDKGNASSTPIDQFSGRIPEDFPAKESEASLETAAVPENERAVQVARTRSFKLFGRTVLVTGSEKVSSSPDTDRYVSAVSQQHCVDVQMSLGLVNHQTSCAEAEIENMSFAEADCSPSCAGSDAGSTNGVENREKSMDAADSQPQGQSSCSEVRFPSLSCYSSKGFMPYKRCLADRDMVASEREQQRARVCS